MMIFIDDEGVQHYYKMTVYLDNPDSMCQRTSTRNCVEYVANEIKFRCVLCHYEDIEEKYCQGRTQTHRRCKHEMNHLDSLTEQERNDIRWDYYVSKRSGEVSERAREYLYTGPGYCHRHAYAAKLDKLEEQGIEV